MKLSNLLHNVLVRQQNATLDPNQVEITTITQDTRKITPGSLFICIKGENFDGHQFIDEALKLGASAIVTEIIPTDSTVPFIYVGDSNKAMAHIANNFYHNPTEELTVYGITGTNGKTTLTHLIDAITREAGHKTGLIGTMYNKILDEEIPTVNTTPDTITLQNLFADMRDREVSHCAMEVSSHGLYQGRTWGIDFDVVVFTNLTQDHLEYHKTIEDYFLAKSLLFTQLGNTYTNKPKTAIINIDDTYGQKLLPLTPHNIYTYGCHGRGDIQAQDIQIHSNGTRFTLNLLGKTYPVNTQLIGDFNVYNLLAAFGACYASGIKPELILSAIEKIKGVKGRFEIVPTPNDVTCIVDYAHTPDGLQNVLETINKFATKKIFCVVGCGGNRDTTKRPLMAKIAVDYATDVIFTSDNPRKEDPEKILADMVVSLNKEDYLLEVDRKKAINQALELAQPGDIVLVAGKGHENYQIIGTTKSHFDDKEVIEDFYTLS